ncbi:MAG: LPS export ABC transporter periplasmic protein LptC [Stanieria sp.]
MRKNLLNNQQLIGGKSFRLGFWLVSVLLLSLTGCRSQSPSATQEQVQPKSPVSAHSDTRLVLNNAVLEQSNVKGGTLWKLKAENTVYSDDQKIAYLDQVTGNLLQNNQLILQLSGKKAEVKDNGTIIFLRDEVIVTDPRNGAILRSDEIEWRPKENLLIIRKNLNGTHPQLSITAEEGRYYTDTSTLELQRNIIATTQEPPLQLKTEHLKWQIPQQQIFSDRNLEIVRYQGDTVTDRLVADKGEVDLAKHTINLHNNIELISLKPQLQIATNFISWNYQTRIINTNQPIQILERQRQLTVTGNQGEIDLQQQVARLDNGVKGLNPSKQSELYARQLIWNIPTETVEAIGNVIYEQAEPQMNLTGDRAVGKLTENKIVVSSDKQANKQVTSVINDQ